MKANSVIESIQIVQPVFLIYKVNKRCIKIHIHIHVSSITLTLFGSISQIMTKGRETIPSDAMKIASETLKIGMKSKLAEMSATVFRYE